MVSEEMANPMPLKSLDLSYCEALTSISSLRGMKLTSLDLGNCKSLKSLRGVEKMPLRSLHLPTSMSLKTEDGEILKSIPTLKYIYMNRDQRPLRDEILAACKKLRESLDNKGSGRARR